MSYKSLSARLFLGSAIILAGLWLLSIRYYSECAFSSRSGNFTLSGTFYSATVGVVFEPHDSREHQFRGTSIPVTSLHHQLRDRTSPSGILRLGRRPTEGCGAAPGHFDYFLDMPIWLIYIAVVGVAFLLGRFSITHSTRAKEKELALQASIFNGGNAPV